MASLPAARRTGGTAATTATPSAAGGAQSSLSTSTSTSSGAPDSPVAHRHANDSDVQVSFTAQKPTKAQRTLGISVEQLRRAKQLHAIGMTDWEYESHVADGKTLAVNSSCASSMITSTSSSTSSSSGNHGSTNGSTGTRSPPQGRSPPLRAIASVHATSPPPLFGPLSPTPSGTHTNGSNTTSSTSNVPHLHSIRQSPSRTNRTLSPTTSTATLQGRYQGATPAYAIPLSSHHVNGNGTAAGSGGAPSRSVTSTPMSTSSIISPDSLTLSPISTVHSHPHYSTAALSPTSKSHQSSSQRALITPSSSPPPIGDDSRSPSYSPSHSPRSRLLPDAPLLRPAIHHGADPPGFLPHLSISHDMIANGTNGSVPSFALPPPASTYSLYDSEPSPSTSSTIDGTTITMTSASGGPVSPLHYHSSPTAADGHVHTSMMVSSPGGSYAQLPLMIPPLAVSTAIISFPSLSINAPSPSVHSSSPSWSLAHHHVHATSPLSPAPIPSHHHANGSPSRSNRNSMTGGMPSLGPLLPPLERLATRSPDVTSRMMIAGNGGTGMVSPQRSRSNTMTITHSSSGSNGSGGSAPGSGNNSGGTSPNPNRLSVGALSPINTLSAHNSASPRDAASPTTGGMHTAGSFHHALAANNASSSSVSPAHSNGNMSVAAAAAVAVLNASAAATLSRTPRRLSPLTGNGPRLSTSGSFVSLPPVHTNAATPSSAAAAAAAAAAVASTGSHHSSNVSSPVGSHGSSTSNSAARGESVLATAGSATDEDFWDDEPRGLLTITNHNNISMHHNSMLPVSPMAGIPSHSSTGSFDDSDSNSSNSAQPMSGGSNSGGSGTPSGISHSYGGTGTSVLHAANGSNNQRTTHSGNRRHARSSSFVLAAPPVIIGQGAHPGLPLSRNGAARRADIAMTSPLPSTRTIGTAAAAAAAAAIADASDSNPTTPSQPVPIPASLSSLSSSVSRSSLSRGLAERVTINGASDRQPSHGHIGSGHHNGHHNTNNGHGNSGHKRHPSNGVLPPLLNMARSPSMNTLITVSNGRISPSSISSPLMSSIAAYMSPASPLDT